MRLKYPRVRGVRSLLIRSRRTGFLPLIPPMNRLFLLLTSVALLLSPLHRSLADEAAASAPPKGLRVLTAGHSFHVWMPGILKEMAANAKIEGHVQVDLSSIGGSQVIQHWNVPDDKNRIKPTLLAGTADVLTLSPIYLPDAGIENFVKLGLEHNPALRITVQEFWMPYDDQALWKNKPKELVIDPDKKTIEELRAAHAPYFQSMDELVRSLNQQVGKQSVFVVPVGQAVLALREKIIKGEVPGMTKQSELFSDAVGHPRGQIQALATFCHFAVIYGRNPVGLPAPSIIAKLPEAEKLNRLLQEIAWQAVTDHPLSGVKAGVAAAPAR